jgi:hypothetical protein
MKLNKFLNQLGDIGDEKKRDRLRKCKQLKNYLAKLKKKAKELEKNISTERNKKKCKEYKEKLKIVNKKREKGLKALKELRKKYC